MYPILFKFGWFTIYTYGLLVTIGFFAGLLWVKAHSSYMLKPEQLNNLALSCLIAGLAGGRALYVVFNLDYFASHPAGIFKIWEGGFVFYGGLALSSIISFILLKRWKLNVLRFFDVFSPALALTHSIGRLGCLASGCCYGKPTTLPWAITFTRAQSLGPLGIPLHPTQIYESLGNFLIFGYLAWLHPSPSLLPSGERAGVRGTVTALYLMLSGLLRFIVEFYRGDEDRGPVFHDLTTLQLAALAMSLGGIILFYRSHKNGKNLYL